MPPTYRIRDWEELFETAETRKLKALSWVPVPNKHDGKGFRRVMKAGPTIYAAWVLIVQVASKCPVRGTLADRDGALTAEDLAVKTDFPEAVFEQAFKILTDKKIAWLELVGDQPAPPADQPDTPADDAGAPAGHAEAPADAGRMPADPPERREGKGREGKGTEGKGMDLKTTPPTPPPAAAGDGDPPPSGRPTARPRDPAEIQAYLDELGENRFTGADVWDHYRAQGWTRANGRPVKDWRATIRVAWIGPRDKRGEKQPRGGGNARAGTCHFCGRPSPWQVCLACLEETGAATDEARRLWAQDTAGTTQPPPDGGGGNHDDAHEPWDEPIEDGDSAGALSPADAQDTEPHRAATR